MNTHRFHSDLPAHQASSTDPATLRPEESDPGGSRFEPQALKPIKAKITQVTRIVMSKNLIKVKKTQEDIDGMARLKRRLAFVPLCDPRVN